MTKYIIGEFFSSGRATLYKNPSDQTVISNTGTSVNGPPLPKKLQGSCAVKYNNSHVYLTGGAHGFTVSTNEKKVWIFDVDSSSWTEGPTMNEARNDHGCAVLHH